MGSPLIAISSPPSIYPETLRRSQLLHLPLKPSLQVRVYLVRCTPMNTSYIVLDSSCASPEPGSGVTPYRTCLRFHRTLPPFNSREILLFQSHTSSPEPGTVVTPICNSTARFLLSSVAQHFNSSLHAGLSFCTCVHGFSLLQGSGIHTRLHRFLRLPPCESSSPSS